MNEDRDVATATRPPVVNDFTQIPVTPLTRIEPPKQQPLPEMRTVEGVSFTREQVELLKRTIARDASDDELELFLYQCRRTRLDPFTRQCYFMKRTSWDKNKRANVTTFQFETSIDGLRLIAERTDKYAGQVAPEWADVREMPDLSIEIKWYPVWPYRDRDPYAARVAVLRKDFDQPLYAVARFDAYAQTVDIWENGQKTEDKRLNAMWQKRGAEQLAKCAEALALRQAFPNEMSGVYTSEEMGQAENDRADDAEERDEYTGQQRTAQARDARDTREPKRRTGTKQERSERADRAHRSEPLAIFAGKSVSRYATKFPFGQPPIKGAALDQNLLTDDRKQVIEREYVVTADLLARAYEWSTRALDGKQTIDEVIDGKKTGERVPVVLDDAGRKRFESLKRDIEKEIERRQIERDEAMQASGAATPRDNTAADDAREQLAEERGEGFTPDRGEAYEGD